MNTLVHSCQVQIEERFKDCDSKTVFIAEKEIIKGHTKSKCLRLYFWTEGMSPSEVQLINWLVLNKLITVTSLFSGPLMLPIPLTLTLHP